MQSASLKFVCGSRLCVYYYFHSLFWQERMKSTASYLRQFELLQKCWLQLKKGWNEYYDPVFCCNQKTWGLIISTEQTTFSLSVCTDCLPASTGFLIKLQNFDWVQLKWFLSGLLLRFPWSLNCWQQQQQTSHLPLTVVEFSEICFWSFLFLCQFGNSSAQSCGFTGNQKHTASINQENAQSTSK